jgi:hypothetical protein
LVIFIELPAWPHGPARGKTILSQSERRIKSKIDLHEERIGQILKQIHCFVVFGDSNTLNPKIYWRSIIQE